MIEFTYDNISNWYLVGISLAGTGAVTWVLTPVWSWFSRKMEYAADAYAKSAGYGKALQSALIKLTSDNFSVPISHPAVVWWYFNHPQVIDRIDALN